MLKMIVVDWNLMKNKLEKVKGKWIIMKLIYKKILKNVIKCLIINNQK